jgi:host factor-I protein
MQNKANLQDIFLTRARRDRVPTTLFLMNGFQLRGVIVGFDAFVVIIDTDGRQQIIYKHAISTIVPIRPVDLSDTEDRGISEQSLSAVQGGLPERR